MQVEEKAALLRIFIGENDRFGQHPLYEAIVLKASPPFYIERSPILLRRQKTSNYYQTCRLFA